MGYITINENIREKILAAGLGGWIGLIDASCKSYEAVEATAIRADDFRRVGLNTEQIKDIARYAISDKIINAIADNLMALKEAGLNERDIYFLAIYTKHINSGDIITAVSTHGKTLQSAGLKGEDIKNVALDVTSVEIIDTIAKQAKHLQEAGLNGAEIATLAVTTSQYIRSDKPEAINVIAKHIKTFFDYGLESRFIANIPYHANRVEEIEEYATTLAAENERESKRQLIQKYSGSTHHYHGAAVVEEEAYSR